jgi:serine/threonine protein phosphatase 1
MKRIAIFGDVHGALDQLERLYKMLENYSLDAVEHCGDLIDRGPDPAGVIQFCRENSISGVLGNHESVILQYPTREGNLPRNPDKLRTYGELLKDPRNFAYLATLPYYKIHSDRLLHCHAGMNPYLAWKDQDLMWATVSLVHPMQPGKTQWAGKTKTGIPEDVMRKHGWVRWYEAYRYHYDVVVGHRCLHSTEGRADVHQTPRGARIYHVDTGAWYHENLTAVIYPDEIFVSTKLGEYRLT